MFMQIFIALRLFALQGRYMSKVCSVRKSSGAPLPIYWEEFLSSLPLEAIWNKLLLLPTTISTR